MKTCLITGGTGFIGSAVTRLMLQKGYRVRLLDNNSRGAFRRILDIENKIDIRVGDIRDFNFVQESICGADLVIHLAYVNGTNSFYEKPREVLEVAILGIQNV